MNNPFESIDARLSNIETLLLDIKHFPREPQDNSDLLKSGKRKPFAEIIDMETCSEITGYSKSAIYARTSKGLIPCFRRDGKLLFRKDEILNWLTENRVISQSDFSENLDGKLTNKKRPSHGK